ncbi:hypothetical protein [Sorangium sp. So ce1078]|uniref:hypothetical protein n=1 Tax=Sorangium sp. So ce1078 TaxID=3133329 RepID=UPI003F636544
MVVEREPEAIAILPENRASRGAENEADRRFDLSAEYDAHGVALAAVRGRVGAGTCALTRAWNVPCWRSASDANRYLLGPPFQSTDELNRRYRLRESSGSGDLLFGWAPISDVVNGAELLASWNAEAAQPQGASCDGRECRIVVRVAKPSSEGATGATQEKLLSCRAMRLTSGALGAPESCNWIAAWDGEVVRVPVVLGVYRSPMKAVKAKCCGAGWYSIRIRDTAVSVDSVKQAAIDALRGPPHSLAVEQIGNESVAGTGQQGRASSVLPPLFEWPTVHVSVSRIDSSEIVLQVTVAVLVSPRAADGWRPPRESERDNYKASVRDALKEHVQLLCAGTWVDTFTFSCS